MNKKNHKANLVISCPDRAGIVFETTRFLFHQGANITSLEQHIEDGVFFMRTEWDRSSFRLLTEPDFERAFEEIREKFQMNTSADFCETKKRIGLFCSNEGHCVADLLARIEIGELPAVLVYVLSNSENMRSIVEKFQIPFFFVPTGNSFEHEKFQKKIIQENPTDVLGLARYMKVLTPEFITEVGQKIINVHHSFLPSFIGAKPYHEAYERGVKLIGATAHYVIPELDRGPIIEQRVQRITHSQDIEKLKLMGRESEKEAFAFAIRKHIENKLIIYKNRVIVFE